MKQIRRFYLRDIPLVRLSLGPLSLGPLGPTERRTD